DCMLRKFIFIFVFVIPICSFAMDFPDSTKKLETELTAKYGATQHDRLMQGMKQVSEYWRKEDGDAAAFEAFVRDNFAGDQKTLDAIFDRFEKQLEELDGHMLEIARDFRKQTDLDLGPILPIDQILAAYDPYAHINDDFFENKLAFIALLNFPITTLDQRLTDGNHWTRRQWAEARLALRFSHRIPAEVNLEMQKAAADSDQYISEYNIWMHHLLDEQGNRLFPPKLRLITHWNLRDELKADYSDPKGLPKQQMIQTVMERIVTQSIPQV